MRISSFDSTSNSVWYVLGTLRNKTIKKLCSHSFWWQSMEKVAEMTLSKEKEKKKEVLDHKWLKKVPLVSAISASFHGTFVHVT